MTSAPPVPVHPRLGARLAYRVQQVLRPHAGFRWLSARIEASGPARTLFTGAEREVKAGLFGCRMCGQCTLPATGYVCPMGCPVRSRRALDFMRDKVPGVMLPDDVYRRLRAVPADRTAAEGARLAAETVQQVADIPGVARVHLLVAGNEQAVPGILDGAGVAPSAPVPARPALGPA
jgi:hypothetical protein